MRIELNDTKIRRFAFLYIALPLLVFLVGFLRWYYALASGAALVAAVALAWQPRPANRKKARARAITISLPGLLALLGVALLWCYLGGLNGLYYQSDDWVIRNPIFRDLITRRWPVVYGENGAALVYYIGFWLPAAAVGKITCLVTGSTAAGWLVGRQLLWLWAALGVFLAMLLLLLLTRADTARRKVVALLVFVFFSGLDIIGAACDGRWNRVFETTRLHLEWWSSTGLQFSSVTTCLFWVFNQSVIPWVVMLCFLQEPDPRNYLLLGLGCLCCGPFPFVGLVVCMAVRWFGWVLSAARGGAVRKALGRTASPANLLLLLGVAPFLAAYYLCNEALGLQTLLAGWPLYQLAAAYLLACLAGAAALAALAGVAALAARVETARWFRPLLCGAAALLALGIGVALWRAGDLTPEFLLFYLLEAGVYLLLLWRPCRKNPLFYTALFSLLLIPHFEIGSTGDFCMRASLPALFLLMVYTAQFLVAGVGRLRQARPGAKLRYAGLVCALCVGACTPLLEVYRGLYHVATEKTLLLAQDGVVSMGEYDVIGNFMSRDYLQQPFYTDLARPVGQYALRYLGGAYPAERQSRDGGTLSYRWSGQSLVLGLYNAGAAATVQFELTAEPLGVQALPYTLTFACQDAVENVTVTQPGQQITLPLPLAAGDNTLTITCNAAQVDAPGDPRSLYFTFSAPRLLAADGSVLAGTGRE